MSKPINHKQRLWIAAMVKHGSPTRAAEECGLSVSQSKHLASKPEFAHVQEALRLALEDVQEAAVYTAANACEELAEVYALAMNIDKPNLQAAVSAVMGRAKILGLDNHAKQLDVNVMEDEPELDFSSLTDEEVEQYAALQAKLEGATEVS